MAESPLLFILGLIAIALFLERVMEWVFGWMPNILKKAAPIRSKRIYRDNIGRIITVIIIFIGWSIANIADLFLIKELFGADISEPLDALATGVFIAVLADIFHQVIRLIEEKKKREEQSRILTNISWYRKKKAQERKRQKSRGGGSMRRWF
jgi:hypothetical protein